MHQWHEKAALDWWMVAAFLVVLVAAPVHSAPCPSGLIEVEAGDDRTVGLVCGAGEAVLLALATCGIDLQQRFQVAIVRRLPRGHSLHYLGYFDRGAGRVVVLEYPRCVEKTAAFGGLFDLPMTPALYRSLLIHEITHAVIEQNKSASRLRKAAHEYAAYAIQLSTMDGELRRRILASYPHAAPIADRELSGLYHDLSPADFAVKAYLHFTMPDNGCDYLRDLLRGERTLPTGLE